MERRPRAAALNREPSGLDAAAETLGFTDAARSLTLRHRDTPQPRTDDPGPDPTRGKQPPLAYPALRVST